MVGWLPILLYLLKALLLWHNDILWSYIAIINTNLFERLLLILLLLVLILLLHFMLLIGVSTSKHHDHLSRCIGAGSH